MNPIIRWSVSGLAAIAVGTAAAVAFAQQATTTTYKLELTGANEVPPVTTPGTGTADVTYDPATKMLTWTVTYSGLTGDATAAHFHGPAAPGSNAGVMIPIEDLSSPMEGSATLNDEQAAALTSGQLYINIHTAANRGGEIRAQVAQ